MSNEVVYPTTLQEAVKYFSNSDACISLVAQIRWPNGVICPHCSSQSTGFLSIQKRWKCKNRDCRKQFSAKVGTIMEDSPLGLEKWLAVMWMISNCKNGISSYEIHRELGVTQKSAWFLLHRIRLAMQEGTIEGLSGKVEADETYGDGETRNMY